MALIDQLQALLDPNHATAEPAVPVMTVVQTSGQQMETVMAALSLADLTPEVVQNFAGKNSVQSIGVLLGTATGLAEHPEVSAATQVMPADAINTARLMIAAGGVQTGFAAVHEGYDNAVLAASRDADAQVTTTLNAVEAQAAKLPPDQALVLRCLFAEASRMRSALAQGAAPESKDLSALQQQAETRTQVTDLLNDIRNHSLALPDLAAASAAATAVTPSKKKGSKAKAAAPTG